MTKPPSSDDPAREASGSPRLACTPHLRTYAHASIDDRIEIDYEKVLAEASWATS